jgi:hypothetical protein
MVTMDGPVNMKPLQTHKHTQEKHNTDFVLYWSYFVNDKHKFYRGAHTHTPMAHANQCTTITGTEKLVEHFPRKTTKATELDYN